MRVIYSIGAPLGGGGLGDIAYWAVRAIHRHGWLARVLAPSAWAAEIPEGLVRTFPLNPVTSRIHLRIRNYVIKDSLFDLWAATQVQRCDVFYGWAHHSLLSLRRAHRLGAVTIIDRQSAEARAQRDMVEAEYRRLGIRGRFMSALNVRRMVREADETDVIAVPSQFVRQTFLEAGYPDRKLFLNPLGVNLSRFSPAPARPDVFRAVYVGMLSVRKGVHHLLRTWNRLGLKEAELCLVGHVDRDLRGMLQHELGQPGVSNVVLRGVTPTPEAEYRRSTIFVLPSLEDGFGSVVIEAMACGLPVIVTDRAGAKDCVREGVDGFVVPAGDAEALAERIRYLHANPDRTAEMGRNAAGQAGQFSWDAYQSRLLAMLDRIAGAGLTGTAG